MPWAEQNPLFPSSYGPIPLYCLFHMRVEIIEFHVCIVDLYYEINAGN